MKKKLSRSHKARARTPAKKKTIRRRKKIVARPPKRKPAAKNPGVAKIDASIKRYEKAARLAHQRAEEIAQLSHHIAEAAVEKFRVSIVADWAESAFLRDILDLRQLFAANLALPKDVESFRLLPDALLQWLGSRFDLHPSGDIGETLEIPAERLRNYSYDFDPPEDPRELVGVRIVSPGWKRNKVLLLPPRVELLAAAKQELEPQEL